MRILTIAMCLMMLAGCAANQKVNWKDNVSTKNMTFSGVNVSSLVDMPEENRIFLINDLKQKLSNTEFCCNELSQYKLNVVISKYEEGSAIARFMLIGLGQMHLHGSVKIVESDDVNVVEAGNFQKKYVVGGFAGLGATMEKDVLPKVADAIIEALNKAKNDN